MDPLSLKLCVCVFVHVCAGCSTAVNDLVYIVDGSWSVGFSDFDTAKQWLINITSQFDISSHYTQVIYTKLYCINRAWIEWLRLSFPFALHTSGVYLWPVSLLLPDYFLLSNQEHCLSVSLVNFDKKNYYIFQHFGPICRCHRALVNLPYSYISFVCVCSRWVWSSTATLLVWRFLWGSTRVEQTSSRPYGASTTWEETHRQDTMLSPCNSIISNLHAGIMRM